MLLALNDRHIDRTIEQQQSARGVLLQTLRLPASSPWPERLRCARSWLDSGRPDRLSFQFVAYGLHPKGLIGDLSRQLAILAGGRTAHLMLHELWIGMERSAPLRRRLVGLLQRRGVLSLIRHLRPAVIHTSNPTYIALLRDCGVQARLLPLCGSIPVALKPDSDWLGGEMAILGVPPEKVLPRENCWRFGIFGSLHTIWSPEPLFTYISDAAQQAGRDVIIVAAGRFGAGQGLWASLQRRYAEHFTFVTLGERSAEELSLFFQSIDFGIAMTPWQLIGKSAATAAMLDHGVPVIVSRDDAHYGVGLPDPDSPLLYRMDADSSLWLRNTQRQAPQSRLPEMAARFVADLEPGYARAVNASAPGRARISA